MIILLKVLGIIALGLAILIMLGCIVRSIFRLIVRLKGYE